MAAPLFDLRLDLVERFLFQGERWQRAQEGRGGFAWSEMFLDDDRERLPGLFVAGQEFVSVHIDGNRLYCHALTVHLFSRVHNGRGTAARSEPRAARRFCLALARSAEA